MELYTQAVELCINTVRLPSVSSLKARLLKQSSSFMQLLLFVCLRQSNETMDQALQTKLKQLARQALDRYATVKSCFSPEFSPFNRIIRQGRRAQTVPVQMCCSSESRQVRIVWRQIQHCWRFWRTRPPVFPPRAGLHAGRALAASAGASGAVRRASGSEIHSGGDRGAQVRPGASEGSFPKPAIRTPVFPRGSEKRSSPSSGVRLQSTASPTCPS